MSEIGTETSVRPGRMRIAYFAGTMRPGHDGVTRVLYRMIDDLRTRPIDHLFFSPLVPPHNAVSARIHRVPSIRFPLYRDYRLALPGGWHFVRALDDFRPDLLHINSPCPLGLAAVRYGRRRGIPVVATYHTHFPSYAKYYRMPGLEFLAWAYLRALYSGCARILVPSQSIIRELQSHGIQHLRHLPHGVDTAVFHPRFRSEGWKMRHGLTSKHVLLYVGRLVWEKDLATLAHAWRLISAGRQDVAMVLVGDGPVRTDLQRMMPGALLLGTLAGEELSVAYASSDILVFPSTTETFGNVTIEALSSGVVPLCAREGGAYEGVKDGVTGLHIRPRDAGDLVRQVERLLDDPLFLARMSAAGLEFARTQSWQQIFDRLMEEYAEVLRISPPVRNTRRTRKAA